MGFAPGMGATMVWAVVKSLPWECSLGYDLMIVVRRRRVNIVLLAAGLGLLWVERVAGAVGGVIR